MIKTATPSVTQDVSGEAAEFTKEASGKIKETSSVGRESSPVAQESPVNTSSSHVVLKQASESVGESSDYYEIKKELDKITRQLNTWQSKVNELFNDPSNADKIGNYMNGIQFLTNRRAELNAKLRVFSSSSNDFSFQDNQSILHAGSVRRKDTEALKIVNRYSRT